VEVPVIRPDRARPVQVFPQGIKHAAEVRIPRTGAMPLRTVVVFGPAPGKAAEPVLAPAENAKASSVAPAPESRLAPPEKVAAEPKPATRKPAAPAKPGPAGLKSGQRVRPEPDRKAAPQTSDPGPSPSAELPDPVLAKAAEPAPKREAESVESAKAETAPLRGLDLGLTAVHLEARTGLWGRLPWPARAAIVLVVAATVSGLTYMVTSSGGSAATKQAARRETVQPGMPIPDASWVADWAPDPRSGRRISILKSALPLADYRVQFDAQIESKAIGWVYRAKDPKNYYVAKIEVIRPGLDPVVALFRFAVVDGQDQERIQVGAPMKVRVDTLYKIRFEAVGSRFTTWIGGEKTGEWTDDRFPSGPPGLFNERGESAAMHGNVNVIPLVIKSQ
jgi:hypothetical protein